MALDLVTAPTVEPLTVSEARTHLRLDGSAGEPAPTAPTAALASPAAAGNVDNGAHRYLATFVTADGETEAGAVSTAVTVADKTVNGQVALTGIPLGGAAVTARKLYRTAAGGTTYLLLATIANNTASTYTDNIADSSLAAQAPSTNTTVDPYVTRLITAARDRGELATWRQFNTATWDLTLPCFPCSVIELPKPPLISVTHVKYVASDGTLTTLEVSTDYTVHTYAGPRGRRGLIEPAYATSWPTPRSQVNAVQIRFVCGYGATAAAVPAMLRQALLVDMGTLYEHRDDAGEPVMSDLSSRIYRSFKSRPRYVLPGEAVA